MAQEAVAAHVALTIGLHLLDRIRRIRFLKYKLVRPNADMRVAFSALLRICEGGRYLLIRNLHRPQTFGPFGGVYKYYGGAKKELDEILFRPQDLGPGSDMKDDLRGFLPRKNLVRVDRWFAASHERESPGECLRRELTEELKETKPSIRLPVPGALPLSLVRVVHEGP